MYLGRPFDFQQRSPEHRKALYELLRKDNLEIVLHERPTLTWEELKELERQEIQRFKPIFNRTHVTPWPVVKDESRESAWKKATSLIYSDGSFGDPDTVEPFTEAEKVALNGTLGNGMWQRGKGDLRSKAAYAVARLLGYETFKQKIPGTQTNEMRWRPQANATCRFID